MITLKVKKQLMEVMEMNINTLTEKIKNNEYIKTFRYLYGENEYSLCDI